MEFKVNDKVIVSTPHSRDDLIGKKGTIVAIDTPFISERWLYTLRMDESINNYFIRPEVERGKCWLAYDYELELVSRVPLKPNKSDIETIKSCLLFYLDNLKLAKEELKSIFDYLDTHYGGKDV